MSQAVNWDGGRLVDLDDDECVALLGERAAGRIAWCEADGPVVLPVNYVVHEEAVWVRTSSYSRLARSCDRHEVAVEVDVIDDATHSGWSVLVRGRCHAVARDEVPEDLPELLAWPAGPRPFLMRVEMREVSGRRLIPG